MPSIAISMRSLRFCGCIFPFRGKLELKRFSCASLKWFDRSWLRFWRVCCRPLLCHFCCLGSTWPGAAGEKSAFKSLLRPSIEVFPKFQPLALATIRCIGINDFVSLFAAPVVVTSATHTVAGQSYPPNTVITTTYPHPHNPHNPNVTQGWVHSITHREVMHW